MNLQCILFVGFVLVTVLLLREINGECAWKEDDRSSVVCLMRSLDRSSIVDLEIAVGSTKLSIDCDQSMMDENILPPKMLAKLGTLEELNIEGCKILRLSNETFYDQRAKLRSLTISTHNAQWSQGSILEIESGVFDHLEILQNLDLHDNNIRILPSNTICSMKSLQRINLSTNRFRSTNDLGFHSCSSTGLSELQHIDLSNNELTAIDRDWIRSDLRSVHSLNLQQNNISKISENAFDTLITMKKLNLSFNCLEILPADLFNNCKSLQEIDLQGNKLYQLPSNLFAKLSELVVLNLSSNQLSSHYIDSSIFSRLKRLVVLNLANNALTRLDAQTFIELNFLQILDLKNNSIGFVDELAFMPLTNLHTLNLSGNRLHIVSNGLFHGLYVLSKLVLNNNLITVVESSAFKNCSSLKELDLSSNQLSDIPTAVNDLIMLKSLDLGENRILRLRNDSFKNLKQLTGLRLVDNLISNITCGILYDLPKLHVLNLSKNKITLIERGSFDKNLVIEAIRLDKNLLNDINGVFSTLNSLLWLDLSENQLVWFDYAFIPMNLKWLDIHGNFIEALGNYYKLQYEITVTTLDASHNRITEIGPSSVPNSIELFFVNNNLIRNVYPNTFVDKINLTRVDLYSNAIAKLHLHAIRIAPMLLKKEIPEFYLGGNPFECDCTMGWLRHRSDLLYQQHPRIMDYDNIGCLVSHRRDTPVRLLSSLGHQDFLCRYETLCPATCHCCDLKSCHCDIKCPDNCSCFHDQTGNINKVNCGKQNAFHIPDGIPGETTQLYVDGNHFLELKNHVFNSLKKLKTLYLNSSNIINMQIHTFTGLVQLQKLHLEDNKLTALYGYEFSQLLNLRELYLQGNLLTYIENSTFDPLRQLQVLRLDGNRITTLSTWQMQSTHLRNMKTLTLSNNLWSCGCEFLQELVPFVYESDVVVKDSEYLYCIEGESRRPINSNSTSVCKEYDRVVLPEGIPHGYVPLLGFALSLLFILAILVAIFTVKEQLCCVYSSIGEKPGMGKMKYDALILSSLNDVDFVEQTIVEELKQNKPSMKFGLQHKNVSSSNIFPNANQSKKIVIYLSNNFLQFEWIRPDVRSAVANSWMPGRVILIQTPNLNFATNIDRELINNVGKGILLLKTWEIDFAFKLAYAIESHPTQLFVPGATRDPIWMSGNSDPTITIPYNEANDHHSIYNKSQLYYSSPVIESGHSKTSPTNLKLSATNQNHVYCGIDSDYGSVTNDDSIVSVHRSLQKDIANTSNSNNLNTEINGFLV